MPKGNPNPSPATRFGQKLGKQGKGPKKGAPNAGRPTLSFKEYLATLRKSAATQMALAAALSDPESRGFAPALRVLSEYDEEKPAEKKQLSGDVRVSVVFGEE